MWPFKTEESITKEEPKPLYRMIESVSGEFWVEIKLFVISMNGVRTYYERITDNFTSKEQAQKYIDDRTPKDNQ